MVCFGFKNLIMTTPRHPSFISECESGSRSLDWWGGGARLADKILFFLQLLLREIAVISTIAYSSLPSISITRKGSSSRYLLLKNIFKQQRITWICFSVISFSIFFFFSCSITVVDIRSTKKVISRSQDRRLPLWYCRYIDEDQSVLATVCCLIRSGRARVNFNAPKLLLNRSNC